jgi:uncharacterized protein (UPF0335 family)
LETHAQIETETLDRYVSRLEALNDERGEVNASIKAVYEEAKNAGFVTAIIRQIVKERRMEETERHDHYALLDAYRSALGMLAELPLGQAAMDAAARNGQDVPKPKPFAAQPVHDPERKRGRRKVLFDQEHPQGTA